MTKIDDRRRFIQDLPSIALSTRRPPVPEGIDLESCDIDGDHVVSGDEEVGKLYDLLKTVPDRPNAFLESLTAWNETETRATFLAALPTVGDGRGREPVQAFLDAIDARAAGEEKPQAVPGHVWLHAGAALEQGVTPDDVRSFLVRGALNEADLTDIEKSALQDGDWSAVNTLTFLVDLRRSSASSQVALVRADLDEDPSLAAVVAGAEAYDAELKATLDAVYDAATIGRERGAAIAVDEALASDDVAGLDEAAALAVEEAEYRERMSGAGWDPSSAYELAAEAKIHKARITGDAADLEAAAALLERARGTKAPTADSYAVEMVYHQTRAELARTHTGASARKELAEARVAAASAALARLETFPTDPSSALEAQRAGDAAADARRALGDLAELTGAAARSQVESEHAAERSRSLAADLEASGTALEDTRTSLEGAKQALEQAESDAAAWTGDFFKSEGQARRDRAGVEDAQTLVALETERLRVSSVQYERLETMAESAATDASTAASAAAQGRMDARFVRDALIANPGTAEASVAIDDLHRSVVAATDEITTRELALLDRVTEGRAGDGVAIAARRIEIARFEMRATELLGAIDDRRGATTRLDRADELLDLADATRSGLKPRSAERQWLATMSIDARSALAQSEGDYRNGHAAAQIDEAKTIARSDLSGEMREAAEERIGSSATIALVRADARLDEIIATGGYWPTANDSLYRSAHAMLDGTDTDAVELLDRVDGSLDAVEHALASGTEQVRTGHAYTKARMGGLSRAEAGAAQAKMSTIESFGGWWITLGHEDPRENVAVESEIAALQRLAEATDPAAMMIVGGKQLQDAWDSARLDDRSFEMLGAMRVLAADGSSEAAGAWTSSARQTLMKHVPREYGSHADWRAFYEGGIVGGQVPAASSLRGPALGVAAANDALGSRELAALTPEMRQALDDQTASLMATTDGMGWRIALNVSGEFALGLLLTGGLGSGVAVGEGVSAFNGARSALSAMQALRSVGMLARTGRVLSAIRNSRIAYTALTTTATGIAMTGAQMGLERVVGRNTHLAAGFGSVAGIAPVMVGQRAAGLYSAASKSSAGRQLAAQLMLGAGQIHVGVLAPDPIAETLGVESELGKAGIGVAVDTMMSTGLAAGAQYRARARTRIDTAQAELIAADRKAVATILGEEITAIRQQIETDPTPVSYDQLTARLKDEAGLGRLERKAIVDAVREDVVDRTIVSRLEELTLATREPSKAEVQAVIRDTAERAGMAREDATVLAADLSESIGLRKWLRDTAMGQDFSSMTNLERQADFLRRNPAGQSLGSLTPDQFVAAFGEGPYTPALAKLAARSGFDTFAAANPAEAGKLYRGVEVFGMAPIDDHPSRDFGTHAAVLDGFLPERTIEIQGSRGRRKGETHDYRVIDGTLVRNLPALQLAPTKPLDHNGAFMVRGPRKPGWFRRRAAAGSEIGDPRFPLEAKQLVLGLNADGSQIRATDADMSRIAVFAGHGATDGFTGLSTEHAATLMAHQIANHNGSHAAPIEFVVLRACSQGDRRGPLGLTGKTNAAVFHEAVNAELSRLGQAPVKVLAAEKPGVLYGGRYSQYTRARGGPQADFVTPDQQRYRPAPEDVRQGAYLAGGATLLGASALAAGGATTYVVYDLVQEKRRAERAQQQP